MFFTFYFSLITYIIIYNSKTNNTIYKLTHIYKIALSILNQARRKDLDLPYLANLYFAPNLDTS